jgi:hypothetical protein
LLQTPIPVSSSFEQPVNFQPLFWLLQTCGRQLLWQFLHQAKNYKGAKGKKKSENKYSSYYKNSNNTNNYEHVGKHNHVYKLEIYTQAP